MPKPRVFLPPSVWRQIQAAFELDPSRPTKESLAKLYGCDSTTIVRRAKLESWQRKDSLATQTIQEVERQNKSIVERTAATVADKLSRQIADTLEPWIAKEKSRHVTSQIKRSKRALRQLDRHINPNVTLAPKDSAFIAKTANDWDNIARRNLGLSDGSVPNGSLQLNILTNHSAVQITPRKEP